MGISCPPLSLNSQPKTWFSWQANLISQIITYIKTGCFHCSPSCLEVELAESLAERVEVMTHPTLHLIGYYSSITWMRRRQQLPYLSLCNTEILTTNIFLGWHSGFKSTCPSGKYRSCSTCPNVMFTCPNSNHNRERASFCTWPNFGELRKLILAQAEAEC